MGLFDTKRYPPPPIQREPLWKYEPAEWEKCPVCYGSGETPSSNTSTDARQKICHTCDGQGIINKLTGKPPQS